MFATEGASVAAKSSPARTDDSKSSKRNLASIQCLRGVAAVAVALHHASDQIEQFTPYKEGSKTFWVERLVNTDVGAIGVDIFFLISGFIMAYTAHVNPGMSGPAFLRKRFLRIYPLYWIFSFVVLGLHLTPWIGRLEASWLDSIKALLLYPQLVHYDGLTVVRPVLLAQGWTLIYEIVFYLLFASMIRLGQLQRVAAISAVFVTLALGARWIFPDTAEGVLLRDPIVLEFSGGLLLGWAFSIRRLQLPSWLVVAGFIAASVPIGFLLFTRWYQDLPRIFAFGLPALLIVGGLLLNRNAERLYYPGFLKLLGDASYSIYLTHTVVLLLFITAYTRLPQLQSLPYDLYYAILVVAMIAAGIATYLVIEKPLTAALKRWA